MVTTELLLNAEDIRGIVRKLAIELRPYYQSLNPVLLCILKGAFIFTADLARELAIPLTIEFLHISSYDDAHEPKRIPNVVGHPPLFAMKHRHVIIVDDVMDYGQTLEIARADVGSYNPASTVACVLLDKPSRHLGWVRPAEYIGRTVENHFVVGYGMGDGEDSRGISSIHILRE